MRITRNWLGDYVDLGDLDPETLAGHLIRIGFDVEEIAAAGADVVLAVDVPSNRPDALGILGLARELAARLKRPLRIPPAATTESGPPAVEAIAVDVASPADCPRYTARLVRGVRVGPAPAWMRERLAAAGIASVNAVVDITNYVLTECGQPLHAFDANRLRGSRIAVRRGAPGERLEAINGRSYPCGPDVLVIADAAGPVALAGIMGGKPTEIGPEARDILLESAQFDPVVIRRASRALGLDSESSYRFERGVSFEGVDWASRRAAALIEQLAGGRTAPGLVDVAPAGRPPARRIRFRHARCGRLLGLPCDPADVRRLLASLGCAVNDADGAGADLDVEVPEHRRDLQREADLVEEVARLIGYDRIPTTPQIPLVVTAQDRRGAVEARLRERLVALGYQEVLTPSFAEPATAADYRLDDEEEPVIVLGKYGTPDRPLRMAVSASLLDVLRTQERYGQALPRIFEIAAAYGRRPGGEPGERPRLGLAVREDFRALRGHVESLAAAVGLDVRFEPAASPRPPWPAGRSAAVILDGIRSGFAAACDAADLRRRDLQEGVCLAELDLAPWIERARLQRAYRDFSRLPEVRRDLAVVVDDRVPWDRIASAVRAAAPPWMRQVEAFDVFHGAQVPPGRKSLAFFMTFQRDDRTLTRQEVDAAVEAVVGRLRLDFGAALR